MLVTHGARRAELPALAVAIGNFDGVHKGHQALIARTRAQAAASGLQSGVLTFEPHPREFFQRTRAAGTGGAAPTRLSSLREKLELLAQQGVDRVHIERFGAAFAALSPEDFVSEVLHRRLRARWLTVGADFRFGARRAGDVERLHRCAAAYGMRLEVTPTVLQSDTRVSSGAVRDALANGDLARAQALLGRPYSISGRVVHGDKQGRQLGFPTANIQLKHNFPPLAGIFAVRVRGAGADSHPGAASLGVRPTLKQGGAAVLEVHLLDFSGELYGAHLRVEFLHKIRDEEKYPDLQTLRAQIERDCRAARELLAGAR